MTKLRFILLMVILPVALCAAAQRNQRDKEEKPDLSITYVMDHDNFYERQPVPLVITLRSSTPDISFARKQQDFGLRKGEFDTFQIISPAGQAYEKTENGRTWYYFPLEAYMISMPDKGKYELSGGEYRIGVSYPVVVHDPFWGKVRKRSVREFDVPVDGKSFKVKSLPMPPADMDFSGSVGEFEIETVIPRGDIFVGEEATAYIVLRGTGMIAERVLPEYRDAFKNGVQLKSISESRDEGHDYNGKMMSELTLECTFVPTDRENAEIGEATFSYFDPVKGKYSVARSKPVKVTVKSTVSKREHIEI